MDEQKAKINSSAILQSAQAKEIDPDGNWTAAVCVSTSMEVVPMHSIACFLGLLFLVIFALIAIPILILVVKLIGLAFIGGAIALIVLGIWKLFDLAEPQYRPYWSHARSLHSALAEVPAPCSSAGTDCGKTLVLV
jgi:hypothetical protein